MCYMLKTLTGLAFLLDSCFRRNDEYWFFCKVSKAGIQLNQYSYQNLAVIFNSQFSIVNYQLPTSITREWTNNSVCIKVQVWLLMLSPLIHTISSNL